LSGTVTASSALAVKSLPAVSSVAQTHAMITEEAPQSDRPSCPRCGAELDFEPVAADHAIYIGYSCSAHGIIAVVDPFDGT